VTLPPSLPGSTTPPPPGPPPRALVFDWDNTLIDSWGTIEIALNATLVRMGQAPWTAAEVRARVRQSLRDSFPGLFGAAWEDAAAFFYRTFAERHLEALVEMPGADALLKAAHGNGVVLAVVSNKLGRYLRIEADHLGWSGRFHRLVGAADAPRDKPAREPVDLALGGSGIAAGPEVWFVGDSGIDMACAVAAGCVPVLIRDGAAGEEFDTHPPHLHFPSCADLARHLAGS